MTPILEIQSLNKNFGGLKALQDVGFDVGRGQIVGLIGPNGAGKTTLFNCVAGVDKPTTGRIVFHGSGHSRDISGRPAEAVTALGVSVATQMCQQLLAGEAPGLHFYTLNRSSATREIYSSLGLQHRLPSGASV